MHKFFPSLAKGGFNPHLPTLGYATVFYQKAKWTVPDLMDRVTTGLSKDLLLNAATIII